jgi:hypothetical protein
MKLLSTSILTISLLVLSSCGESAKKEVSQYDQVLLSVENAVKPKLNDPKSYEFVELVLVDSVLYSENVEYRLSGFKKYLDDSRRGVEDLKRYKESESILYDSLKLVNREKDILENEEIIQGIDSIRMSLGDKLNDVASYTYSFSFRGNNKMGALVLNTYLVQTDPVAPFGVINLAKNEDELFLNPNQFEGYIELVTPIFEKYK